MAEARLQEMCIRDSSLRCNKDYAHPKIKDIGKAKIIVIAQTAHNTIKGIPTKMEKKPRIG